VALEPSTHGSATPFPSRSRQTPRSSHSKEIDHGQTKRRPAPQAEACGTAEGSEPQELVTCVLDDVEFGFDIHTVQEIVRLPKITPVPRAPHYVRGLANLRGNVLPVIDLCARLGMRTGDHNKNSRVVVADLGGIPTGLIVDSVREVLHVDGSAVEPAPSSVQGVENDFLRGVVKLDDGKRLVMLVDQNRIIDGACWPDDGQPNPPGDVSGALARAQQDGTVRHDQEQLVTFRLAHEEYAFPISDVEEIIRVPQITQVPNAPPFVQGISTLRNRVLPVVDLRTKFGLRMLVAETEDFVSRMHGFEQSHAGLVRQLAEAVEGSTTRDDPFVEEECEFRMWRKSFFTSDGVLESLLAPVDHADRLLHKAVTSAAKALAAGDRQGALVAHQQRVEPAWVELRRAFKKMFKGVTQREDERCIVIGVDGMSLALRIDAVNEVLQVPHDAIERTPETLSGGGASEDQIRGVAKLDQGRRLILILDARKLLGQGDRHALVAATGEGRVEDPGKQGATTMGAEAVQDERQFVSFKVGEEEFAADIMQVQEIVRLERITKVPHAPSFVEGVVNLRGSVLPVLDLRRRFGMAEKEYDDATRVVVIDVAERKTGIIVDAVSEVMSLPQKCLEPAPAIIKGGDTEDFIEGVAKLDGGNRMVLVLRTDRLLSDAEATAVGRAVSLSEGQSDEKQTDDDSNGAA